MSLDRIANGFTSRTLKTAKLASKLGLRFAKRAVTGPEGELSAEFREAAVLRAEELVEELGALKGLVMKLGQVASYMPGAMPPEAQRVLSRLQAKTTALSYEAVAAVVEAEFGARPEALFEDFCPEPFAAASIGQVHRATFEGKPVAVKIQYPGIADVLRSDLETVGLLARLSSVGSKVDGGALAAELRDRIVEECDYRAEARNQTLFIELFADPEAHVPAIVPERCTGRVLTSEYVDALDFATFCETAPQHVKDRAGEVIFRTCFDSIFRRCIYNADPHPGNYLFHDDGHVTFLDFGCVRRYDAAFIERWRALIGAILGGDRSAFERLYPTLGFVPNTKRFDWDYQWSVMQYLYEPFLATEPYTFTHDYVAQSYGVMVFDNPNRQKTAMPPEWLFLNRLQWGMNSILASLGATAKWGDSWRESLAGPVAPA